MDSHDEVFGEPIKQISFSKQSCEPDPSPAPTISKLQAEQKNRFKNSTRLDLGLFAMKDWQVETFLPEIGAF